MTLQTTTMKNEDSRHWSEDIITSDIHDSNDVEQIW